MTNEKQNEVKKEMSIVEKARNAAKNPEKLAALLASCTPEQREVVIRTVNGVYQAQADKLKKQGKTAKAHTVKKTENEKTVSPFEISRGIAGVKKYLTSGEASSAHDIKQALKGWAPIQVETLKQLTNDVVNVSQHFFISNSVVVLVKTEKANALNVGWVMLDCGNGLATTIFPPYKNVGKATDEVNTKARKDRMAKAKEKAVAYAQAVAEVVKSQNVEKAVNE